MVNAVVLVSARSTIPEAAQAIADIPGVSEVYSVAGEYDLVAIIRVRTTTSWPRDPGGRRARSTGVARTETLIAFQVYSKHDLEAMFSVGFEEDA